ncbi:MAG: GntR family transcriptional regulator [Tunicatimonas sp.]
MESHIPKYLQIYHSLIESIRARRLKKGDQLPSINVLAREKSLSRDTVVKSFKLLQQKGVIASIHGKGFFVASDRLDLSLRVLLMFDAFTPYKNAIYQSFAASLDSPGTVDICFHYFNSRVVETLIDERLGNYDFYLVIHSGDESMNQALARIPAEQLFFLDMPPMGLSSFNGIIQDFQADIEEALLQLLPRVKHYEKLVLGFRDAVAPPPPELKQGFMNFCYRYDVLGEIVDGQEGLVVQPGTGFVLIDDEDLVNVLVDCNRAGYRVGEEVGVLSYNEIALKKVVGHDGISVISTNFEQMGASMAAMIQNNRPEMRYNPSRVIDRKSF